MLLPLAEEALRQVHKCDIMVNDLHPDNVVLVADGTMTKVFFVEFSHSIPSPSLAQFEEDMYNLRAMFSRKINLNRSDSMMKKTLCA